ncbi:hypothetical protein STASHLEY_00200 [Brevundimonas phage vB_BpoS-StAshley]|nr:hypothetical protein STASHLEY_00200 [Brevundimonas phage vB_BpoS-StAshley]UTC30113.1 hypothetical protein MAINES_00740 [Brevundimonas phage vB_BpoS-MaInes]
MPNIALIKEDGMPLVVPAGSIHAILKASNQLGAPDTRAMVCYEFRGFSFAAVVDASEDVFTAMLNNLNPDQQEVLGESAWLMLDALPPLKEARIEVSAEEAKQQLGDDITIENPEGEAPAVLGTLSFELPDSLEPVGKTYIRKSIFRGYEGFKSRHTPTGALLELPKGYGMLKLNLQLGDNFAADFCALTANNLAQLNACDLA